MTDEQAPADQSLMDDTQDSAVKSDLGSTRTFHAADVRAGTGIDRYTLLEKLGEGGMGEVWAARQSEPLKRKVALKLIKKGMDSKAVIQRFEQERQALAVMDHPNIAKVLDGGLTEAGQPYFVMELVSGKPLTKFCDDAKLSIKERLDLFLPVCQAVQHAHQKGIIHRDLKPANVLVMVVDGKPVPKVIDFGVAKAVTGKLTEETLSTQVGAVVGTLEYMAPEQAGLTSDDVDTRADVYSLGVLLYELLTGLRPFDSKRLRSAALDEMIRILREEDPPSLSSRLSTDESLPSVAAVRNTEPKRLVSLVKGELDWIVQRCLEKDRNRRYDTANGLTRDIQRFLADEPVEARPVSSGYRLRKFLRRNKGPVLAGISLILTLLIGVAGTTWGLLEARRLAAAERQARTDADAARSDAELQKEKALEAAAAEKAAKEQTQKRLAQIEKGVELFAGMLRGIDPRGEEQGGVPLYVQLRKRAEQAADQLDAEAVGDPVATARLQTVMGNTLRQLGSAAKAVRLLEKARVTRERELGPDHPDTLASRNSLAGAYRAVGKHDEALALYEATLKAREAKLGPDHPYTLASRNNLAAAYHAVGKLDEAVALYEATLKAREAKLGPDHPDTLASRHNLALTYQDAGRVGEALPLHEATLRALEEALGSDHPHTLASRYSLARAYQDAGRLDKALPLYEKAAAGIEKRRFQLEHAGRIIGDAAAALEHAGQIDKPEGWRRKWLAAVKDRSGAQSRAYADALAPLGDNLLRQKKYAGSEEVLRECLALREKLHPDAWTTFNTRSVLGAALLGQKKYADAEPLLLKGYEGMKQREKSIPAQVKNQRLGEAVDRLIEVYTSMNKPEEVKKWKAERAKYAIPTAPEKTPSVGAPSKESAESPPKKN